MVHTKLPLKPQTQQLYNNKQIQTNTSKNTKLKQIGKKKHEQMHARLPIQYKTQSI
jgi:hypothetical protein